jgi:hypothetical protein
MCLEPVREFTPRPVTASTFVGEPSHTVHTSRWRGTDLTFGPMGRIVVTAVVFIALVAGWSATGGASATGLWFFMAWFIVASMVLKHTWQKVRVDPDDAPTQRARLVARFPRLGRGLESSVLRLALAIVGAAVTVSLFLRADTFTRFSMFVVAVMAVASAVLIWLTKL